MNYKKFKKKFRRFFSKTPHMKYVYGWYYKHSSVRKNTILIESFHGKTIGDSSLVFAKEIERLYPGRYKIYYATNNIREHSRYIRDIGLNVELVDIATFRYCKILNTAEYIISNASLPIYYVRKDGQKYLQTWHGTPLKTLGKKMREGIESMYNVQHNFLQATHITFPNEFTRNAIMGDYNLERLYTGDVVMCGYPRNSVFLSKGDSSDIRKRMGTQDKTVYAYMPTWRGKNNQDIDTTDYLNEMGDIFKKLDRSMHDDQVMYVNFHPILKNAFKFDSYEHIEAFPGDIDSYEFLNSVDALVTDYSSVFFDFSLTKKPIVLFMYDYDDYMSERGMYMDVADLPFRQIFDVDEFCKCIAEGSCLNDSYEDSEYFRKFFKYDSPDSAGKLLDLLFNGNASDLEIDSYEKNRETEVNVYAPRRLRTEPELKTLARVASGPDDVVLMYRKWFKTDVGMLLHDKYNDDFAYVITANAPPRTYLEQILHKLGYEKHSRVIRKRDIRRTFPGLKLSGGDYIENYGFNEKGYKANVADAPTLDSKVITKPGGVVAFELKERTDLKVESAVIMDNYYSIITERKLSPEEIESGIYEFDISDEINSMSVYHREAATPGLIFVDDKGKRQLLLFEDADRKEDGRRAAAKKLRTGRTYPPSSLVCQLPADYRKRNLRNIMASHNEYISKSLKNYNLELCDTEMSVIPFMDFGETDGAIRLRVSTRNLAVDFVSDPAKLKGYRFGQSSLEINAFLPDWSAEIVKGGELILDSASEDVRIPMEAVARDAAGGCKVRLSLKYYDDIPLTPIRWHCRIAVSWGDEVHYLKIRISDLRTVFRIKMGNAQSLLPDGKVLFPYAGKGNIFKLCYRQASEYDTRRTKVKEAVALVLRVILFPYFRKNNKYIVYEKFCQTAQDNSYYFFKYCMDNLKGAERNKFYYVIDRRSGDYKNVEEYGAQVIDFMSIKHMLYAMSAKVYVATDSTPHLYVWQSKPSYVYEIIHNKGVLFLQHGVTALKRVDKLFGKKGSSPMKYFVTTSETEQKIVVEEFGYKRSDAPMVGFARWDVLEDKKQQDDRIILVMPTWRQWLEDVDDETFLKSDYYNEYMKLLSDDRMTEFLEKNNCRMILYLHPKFADYLKVFRENLSSRIECVAFGEEPLNNIMMKCHLLITDYSSVCWDVLYMDKPVIFYQFDSDMYLEIHGSYINFEKDLPGPTESSYRDVIRDLEEYAGRDFSIKEEHREMIPRYFAYRDSHNCERTYEFLINREEHGL